MNWENRIVGHGEEAPDQILANPKNWRMHPNEQQAALQGVLEEVGWVQSVIVNKNTGHLVDGHLRVNLSLRHGVKSIPVVYVDLTEEEEDLILASLDPLSAMAFGHRQHAEDLIESLDIDNDAINSMLQDVLRNAVELDTKYAEKVVTKGALADKFIIPPFTVMDTKQGYWKNRKDAWLELGIRRETGRDKNLMNYGGTLDRIKGDSADSWDYRTSSVFDPVLCELVYRWFCTGKGHILDPFAGECVKGIVAGVLGYKYTGIELREEQVKDNEEQWGERLGEKPVWITGDSVNLEMLLPKKEKYDLVFTSPPYYDLEIYSEDKQDGSAFATYDEFMTWYRIIFASAVKRLNDNRFLVVKVGEIRDERGIYRNFVGDNMRLFIELGLNYYNEATLLTPLGTLPVRKQTSFTKHRKLGKAHQNVLVFYKGDPAKIQEEFPHEIEYADISEQTD